MRLVSIYALDSSTCQPTHKQRIAQIGGLIAELMASGKMSDYAVLDLGTKEDVLALTQHFLAEYPAPSA